MNQELRERAEKYALTSDLLGAAFTQDGAEEAYLSGAKDQAERDAKLAEEYARDHKDGKKMPSVMAARWAELSGNTIAERIRASVESK